MNRINLKDIKKTVNYLSIDVEDYFQVSAFEKVAPPDKWNLYESRVFKNTLSILDILEQRNVKATFFIVGWIAERNPELPKDIVDRGHEIGCHSYWHRKIYDLGPSKFREDTAKAKAILEELTGAPVYGYRAPSYTITKKSLWALNILQDLGFKYDSSVFPIHHDTYGIPSAPRFSFRWKLNGLRPEINSKLKLLSPEYETQSIIEYPISTAKLFGQKVPIAGGGYFRLFPYWFTKAALNSINDKEGKPFMFYLHPWEIDPDQPRFNHASMLSRFRHYNNLNKTAERFRRLLSDFKFGPILSE
jgi:polysaccharide deacetylase family protein (PEP-CTERM system associated)